MGEIDQKHTDGGYLTKDTIKDRLGFGTIHSDESDAKIQDLIDHSRYKANDFVFVSVGSDRQEIDHEEPGS